MLPQTIWNTETYVRTYETDFQGRWKPAAALQAMIEASSQHAAALGFDYPTLLEKDMVWVLSRFSVHFYALPAIGQRVLIKTWPKGIQQRLFFMRDFKLSGEDGSPLAAASFGWLLISPRARRLLPPQALFQAFETEVPDNGGLYALDEQLDRIPIPDGLSERQQVCASYSVVDMLGHANASRYVEWVSDCFSQEEQAGRQLAWLRLNYINEIRPGERVSIAAGQNGNGEWVIQGSNLDTHQKSFEASLALENIH